VLSNPDYSPSDALRLSLGLDGPVGQHGMTVGLSAGFYPTHDEISDPRLTGGIALTTQMGPVLSVDWRFRLATAHMRELTVYAVDRYRTKYGLGTSATGTLAVDQSSGNYLDAGIRGVFAAGTATGILTTVNFRHQTGLEVDQTLATARMVSGALTVGLVHQLGSDYVLQPFVRCQLGRLKSFEESTTATGVTGGVTVGVRF
jgi:hypothetical protein